MFHNEPISVEDKKRILSLRAKSTYFYFDIHEPETVSNTDLILENREVVVFDYEREGMSQQERIDALERLVNILCEYTPNRTIIMVKIPSLSSPVAFEDINFLVKSAGEHIDCIVVPDADPNNDIRWLTIVLEDLEKAEGIEPILIHYQVETEDGYNCLKDIILPNNRVQGISLNIDNFPSVYDLIQTMQNVKTTSDMISEQYETEVISKMLELIDICLSTNIQAVLLHGPQSIKNDELFKWICGMALKNFINGVFVYSNERASCVEKVYTPSYCEVQGAVNKILSVYEWCNENEQRVNSNIEALLPDGSFRIAAEILISAIQKSHLLDGQIREYFQIVDFDTAINFLMECHYLDSSGLSWEIIAEMQANAHPSEQGMGDEDDAKDGKEQLLFDTDDTDRVLSEDPSGDNAFSDNSQFQFNQPSQPGK